MGPEQLKIFALEGSRQFGADIGRYLGIDLAQHEERSFEDGEHKVRPLENVRNADVFVLHSLYSDEKQTVNDKLIRLLFFIGALRDAAAARVTAVIPYLCYARKDRKTKARDPLSLRYTATLLESAGADRVISMDVHNLAAYQNAFRCGCEHLTTVKLFVEELASALTDKAVAVVSPDIGGIKRAQLFAQALAKRLGQSPRSAFMDKQRSEDIVSGETLVGQVEDCNVIIVDDLIASGSTIVRAALACRRQGAASVTAVAAHGLFVGAANRKLSEPALNKLIVTNTVHGFRLTEPAVLERLRVVNVAPLFAEAIRRAHEGGSLVTLLET